jgi:hypothetical protein
VKNLEKSHFYRKRGCSAMARHGKQFLAVAEVCALYNSPWQVFYSPWRALQVLTRILAMASEILAMASSA